MLNAIKQSPNYKWWVIGSVALGTIVTVMEFGAVSIAAPHMARDFKTDIPAVQWVITAQMLAISVFLLPMGRLSDMVGRKGVYIGGLLVFILGAALAGTASHLIILVLFRVIQGIGLAMVQGNQMAIVLSVFPAKERGKALGLNMTMVGTGLIIGPVLGGVLVDAFGWRAVFLSEIPLGALSLLPGLLVLDEKRISQWTEMGRGLKFDWLGAALSAVALLTLLMSLATGHRLGWTSPYILGALLACAASLAAFIWRELGTTMPMLDLRLFKRGLFSLSVATRFAGFVLAATVLFMTPFYLQKGLGYSATQAGLILVPTAVIMATFGPLSGRLTDRFGWRTFNIGGLALSAVGMFLLARVSPHSALGFVLLALVLQSMGMAIFTTANASAILSSVPQNRYGVVASFIQLLRNTATVIGVAMATAIVTGIMASRGFAPTLELKDVAEAQRAGAIDAFTTGLRITYLAMGCLSVIAAIASAFEGKPVKQRRPQPSVEPRGNESPPA